jgi:hypothetical protein
MTRTPQQAEAYVVTNVSGLDPIVVFWCNTSAGAGSVTITCYGCAWTAWFGAMGDRTIQQFFSDAGSDYLETKLGITPLLKQRKADLSYLRKIIEAVKESLRMETVA